MLLKRGLLTKEQIEQAQEQTEQADKSYVEILVKNQFVSEAGLLATLASEARIPPVDIEKITPDQRIIQAFNQDWAKSYVVLPLSKINDALTLAVADPFDILKLDDLKLLTGCTIKPVVSLDYRILEGIERIYNPGERELTEALETREGEGVELAETIDEDIDVSELTEAAEDAPIVKFVNMIIYKALEEGASDIHIEPFEKKVLIRYRKDGVLHEVMSSPRKVFNAIISRIKIMTSLDIAERRIPQDGKFQIKYEGRQIDFRVSSLPSVYGEKIVMRVLDSSSITLGLDALGFEPEALDAFREAVSAPYGMILVTGPTGSGKSTTLYSAVKEIMSTEDNFMTVEDPVEYQLEGIGQVPVNPKRGVTFAGALRAILRQDPNKIMVGEIRDSETADIAVKAAMTGHLVLSTLHTNDAASAITRLMDMGIDAFLVASSVNLLSAQRLTRKLCDHCKRPYDKLPPEEKLIEIGFKPEECKDSNLYRPVGCERCSGGYKGRFALLETLVIEDEVRRMIIRGASVFDIKEHAITKNNMIALRRCGLLNVIRGKTSIEEVLRMTEA